MHILSIVLFAANPHVTTPVVVWKDSTGTVLPAAASSTLDQVEYFDSNGNIWAVGVGTPSLTLNSSGGPAPTFNTFFGLTAAYYTSSDCSGPGYGFLDPIPRFVFQVFENGQVHYRAFPDTAVPPVTVHLSSYVDPNGLGCQTIDFGPATVWPLSQTVGPLTVPTDTVTPPLHPEIVR